MKKSWVKILRWLSLSIAIVIITYATLVSAARLLTPYLNDRKVIFESWASALLGAPVSIKHVAVYWHIIEPKIVFNRVNVLDLETRHPSVTIQEIKINLGVMKSLWEWKPIPDSIKISGVQLAIHQSKTGSFHVEGLRDLTITDNSTGAAIKSEAVLGWIFTNPKLQLENIYIRYLTDQASEKSITLNQLSLQNDDKVHVLHGNGVINQDIPTKVDINLKAYGKITDLAHIKAVLDLSMEGVYLPQFLKDMNFNHIEIKEGLASARISALWAENQLQKAQTDFTLYQLEWEHLVTHQHQAIPRASGTLHWVKENNAITLSGEDILLDLPNHLWPTTNFSIRFEPTAQDPYFVKAINFSYLDLADVMQLAAKTELLSDAYSQLLNEFMPKGELHSFYALSHDSWVDVNNLVFSSEFRNISFKETKKFPGIKNLTGFINWNGQNGVLTLDSPKSAFSYAALFENTLTFDQLKTTINWQKKADQWDLYIKNLLAQNSDISLLSNISLKFPQTSAPEILLAADFSVPHAVKISEYLPLKIFKPNLVQWLKNAFQSGSLDSGKAVIEGKLNDFPFDKSPGKFEVTGFVKNLNLKYAPDWPMVEAANAKLDFVKRALSIDVSAGKISAAPIKTVHAVIENMGMKTGANLNLEAALQSDLIHGMEFIHNSPLEKKFGSQLSALNISGPMDLKLKFNLPLEHPQTIKLTGILGTSGASLRLPEWNLTLDQLQGTFLFTEENLQSSNIQAKLFDAPIKIKLATQRESKNNFIKANVTGSLNISALQQWFKLPALTNYAAGAADYAAELRLGNKNEIVLQSNLKGISLKLPEPMNKSADAVRDLKLNILAADNEPLKIKMSYAKLLAAEIKKTSKDWQIDVKNESLNGQITLPVKLNQRPIQARFDRFYINPQVSTNLSWDAKSIPAISFIANDMRFNNSSVGWVKLETAPTVNGVLIRSLDIDSDLLRLHANGRWQSQNGNITQLQGQAETEKLSQVLTNWGFDSSNFVAKKAEVKFNLNWADTPFSPTQKTLAGTLALRLGAGRIIDVGDSSAKMGLGRLLSIFSLQTLPRRLSLNFSDLFEKGYSFDSLDSDLTLKKGNAFTENTTLTGPVADIEIGGRIGLVAKDFDINLQVTPHVTSSLPVVVTFATGAFNPIAGIATWLIDKAVTSKMTTYKYRVKGKWDNPNWDSAGEIKRP